MKHCYLIFAALFSCVQIYAAQKSTKTLRELIETFNDDNYFTPLADVDEQQEKQLLRSQVKQLHKSKKGKKEWQQPPMSPLHVEAVEALPYKKLFFDLFLKNDETNTKEDLPVLAVKKAICKQLASQLPPSCGEIRKQIKLEKKRITAIAEKLQIKQQDQRRHILRFDKSEILRFHEIRKETREKWPIKRFRKDPVGAIVAYITEEKVEIEIRRKPWQPRNDLKGWGCSGRISCGSLACRPGIASDSWQ